MSVNLNAVGGVSPINLEGMDLETMMMAVQSQRAQLLEDQLKAQISGVQAKNDQMGKLNDLQGELNKLSASFASDAKAGDTKPIPQSLKDSAKSAGVTLPSGFNGSSVKKGDLDGYVQTVKSQIDSLSNSQQMDMLRLQSLSNKRNEAFETMTNFMKKMQDSRSSIIGNMR